MFRAQVVLSGKWYDQDDHRKRLMFISLSHTHTIQVQEREWTRAVLWQRRPYLTHIYVLSNNDFKLRIMETLYPAHGDVAVLKKRTKYQSTTHFKKTHASTVAVKVSLYHRDNNY